MLCTTCKYGLIMGYITNRTVSHEVYTCYRCNSTFILTEYPILDRVYSTIGPHYFDILKFTYNSMKNDIKLLLLTGNILKKDIDNWAMKWY